MTTAGVLVFLAAYATAVALPGPGLAALIARVLARGLSGIPAYVAGFAVGDLIWFGMAAGGLAVIAAAFQPLIAVIRYAGAGYLLYVAYRLITAPSIPLEDTQRVAAASPLRDFSAGLTLTLGNPKAIVFFMALMPTLVDLARLRLTTVVMLAIPMAATLGSILGGYALLAARARRLFRNTRAVRALNVGTGAVMAGAAVAIATK